MEMVKDRRLFIVSRRYIQHLIIFIRPLHWPKPPLFIT